MVHPWRHRRKAILNQAHAEVYDLLIVGGGIVGAGIARDAALRGLKTALVECHDFAWGTSSRSSRLLHGGIRYLSQRKIGLVREASLEKTILHRIAPHLAQPLPFIFPAYRETSEWPLWQLRIGVKIYDLLCGGRNLGRSSSMSALETISRVPGLAPAGLAGAVRYFDGLTQDARLVLDTLRSAGENGATLVNYVRFLNAVPWDNGFVSSVADEYAGSKFEIRSRAIVNATGPWSQSIPGSAVKLRLTKGVHIVFPREKLPVQDAVVLTEGSRILFIIPWGSRLIVGTTDTDYSGAPESVRTEPEDIEYLLLSLERYFGDVSWDLSHIISSWSGLRPLIADARRGPSDISRSHQILQSRPNWWDVAGGKLTTYRLIAEQTLDQVTRNLGGNFQKCVTADQPLLSPEKTAGLSQIVPTRFSREAIEHFCIHEWALHLDDIMMRRSSWHFYDGLIQERTERCADWMTELLGWTPAERAREIERYHQACDLPVFGRSQLRLNEVWKE